jgi:phosphomevalonate kinase
MGSSAALTTSLVGALLQWFGVIKLGFRRGDDDRAIVHNLSQLAHAVAQGKIGSGFDVAAAVYGEADIIVKSLVMIEHIQ